MQTNSNTQQITISNGYTLFIDRDGVINKEKKEDYIYTWDEFEFLDGVIEALKVVNSFFETIVLITNQIRGHALELNANENMFLKACHDFKL